MKWHKWSSKREVWEKMEGEKKIKEEIEGCSFKPELNAMTKKIISGEVVKMQKVSKVGGGREGGRGGGGGGGGGGDSC